jgi:TonB family protein
MRVLQGIILSLLIHFILVWSAQFAPRLAARLETKNIEVEIKDETKKASQTETEQKQIVRETLVPDEIKAKDSEEPFDFLSGTRQRVKKQTRAPLTGMTKNRTNEDLEPAPPEPQQQAQQKKSSRLDPRVKGGLDAFAPKYRTTPRRPQELSLDRGMSTVGESLPKELAVGSFTALNTDRYLYYSFFSRIEELIRYRWENSVRAAIDRTPPDRLGNTVTGNWVTQLEIWLKPDGQFHSAHLMKESGIKGFDQAAIQSFVQARLFPNPPKEMVESDGLIHLKYAFEVHYEPKVLVRSRD